MKGTLGVLRAAKDCGVGRVVMVSSQTAMVPNNRWPADKVIDEDSWADVDVLKKLQVHNYRSSHRRIRFRYRNSPCLVLLEKNFAKTFCIFDH